jgi:hypothetical protein
MLKAVTILPEIISLQNTTPPGKLLLGIYSCDPTVKWVLRAMSMTRAGLRKLEQRLIHKRLLSEAGARHMVHVPGFVYTHYPDAGHFVPDSSTSKSEKKVANRASKTTQADIRPLVVPAELLEFRYLTASAKMLLAYFISSPGAKNERVVQTLGMSLSGLKKLKQGLLKKKVLVQTGDGYTIRLPGLFLVRDSHGGRFVSELEVLKNGYEVAHPAPKLVPTKDVYNEWKSSLKKICRQPDTTPSYLLSFTTNMIERLKAGSAESPQREAALAVMKKAENVFFAKDFVYDNIPRKYEAKFMQLVDSATPEQLVALRSKIEGMMVGGLPEPKLLGMVTKAIALAPAQEAQSQAGSAVAHRKLRVKRA